jgi:hypothetical protein
LKQLFLGNILFVIHNVKGVSLRLSFVITIVDRTWWVFKLLRVSQQKVLNSPFFYHSTENQKTNN